MSVFRLVADEAEAEVSLRGAEPLAWRIAGRDLLWHGDPAHWDFRAPILFPLVGASRGGVVQVDGAAYPMPQHGFARRAAFDLVERAPDRVRLGLTDSAETRAAYPYAFRLEVEAELTPRTLSLAIVATNTGPAPMPYALGFHPAFLWPFDAPDRTGHAVVFAEPESATVPEVAPGGLLARMTRPVPVEGRRLPLSPELFSEALVFLDARSRSLAFESPSGARITMETDGFPHLAVWSRPDAPFLSLECWTGHADWADAEGELRERASMVVLEPGATGRHAVTLRYEPA